MTTALTAWTDELGVEIGNLPSPSVKAAVRRAAREFCDETHLWTLELARISIVADDKDYALTVPAAQYGEIIFIDDVKYKEDGEDDDTFITLDPISKMRENLDSDGSWQYHEADSPSHYYPQDDDLTTLVLYPIPTEASASGLLVTVGLRPTLGALVVPDFIYNQHFTTITAGALQYLFGLKAMPWFDPNAAMAKRVEFRRAINSAKYRRLTGMTNRPLEVRKRRFV